MNVTVYAPSSDPITTTAWKCTLRSRKVCTNTESPPNRQHLLPKNRVDRIPTPCPKTESSQGLAARFVESIEEQD
uniref:Uncharacterized protein n=1 Tax=Romanomermis culicivorax TaxID=13658 RepID=A0A915J2F3_ROMCU